MSRQRRSWLPTLEGNERLAAILIVAAVFGMISLFRGAPASAPTAASQASAAPPDPSSAPGASSPASAAAAPLTAREVADQIEEFCDLRHGARATLTPTSLSPTPKTEINPLSGQPVTYQPRKLTPAQVEAARRVLKRPSRTKLRDDCHLLDLGDGERVVIAGLDTSCEEQCRFHARQLDPRVAELVLELATAASMTIDIEDHVYVPAGVKSDHAGETYAATVKTPDELSKRVVASYRAGVARYGERSTYRGRETKSGGED